MAVKGLARLNRQFKALSRLQIEAARTSLHQNAEELSQAIQRAVPVDRGDLAASVGWSVGDAPAGALGSKAKAPPSASQTLKDSEGLRVTVHAGDENAIHARWVEFGTAAAPAGKFQDGNGKTRTNKQPHVATAAQPFFYPTIMARKKRLKSRVVRNANKAAKLAAKVR